MVDEEIAQQLCESTGIKKPLRGRSSHYVLAAEVSGRIEAEEFISGAILPGLVTFAAAYDVSQTVVTKAFALLQADGLIATHHPHLSTNRTARKHPVWTVE